MTKYGNALLVVDQDVREGWLEVNDGIITAVEFGDSPADAEDLKGQYVLPGFVDQHCHGGGEGDVSAVEEAAIRRVSELHTSHGTTSLMASLVTATKEDLLRQIAALAPLVDSGMFFGIHLEGPWISKDQCGAHDVNLLRSPDIAEIDELLAAADGRIAMVTIAPELPGSMAAIRHLVGEGVVVAVGHTDCDMDTAQQAIEAGATVATHLLNRMPPLEKRAPGPVLALLSDPRVTVELIADGVHVHPAMIEYLASNAGSDRVAIITDAMAAAGAADGAYVIGKLDVEVRDGVARLKDTHALAGSTLTLDVALRVLVDKAGFTLPEASRMLSGTPARAMGLNDRGLLATKQRADLVTLDDDLQVTGVMRGGEWVSRG